MGPAQGRVCVCVGLERLEGLSRHQQPEYHVQSYRPQRTYRRDREPEKHEQTTRPSRCTALKPSRIGGNFLLSIIMTTLFCKPSTQLKIQPFKSPGTGRKKKKKMGVRSPAPDLLVRVCVCVCKFPDRRWAKSQNSCPKHAILRQNATFSLFPSGTRQRAAASRV